MPSADSTEMYTSLDAARHAYSGAFITAWPADEPYLLPPSLEKMAGEMAYRHTSRPGAASQTSLTESLTQSPSTETSSLL